MTTSEYDRYRPPEEPRRRRRREAVSPEEASAYATGTAMAPGSGAATTSPSGAAPESGRRRRGGLAPAGSDGARWGLEHFAIESDGIEADIARLQKLGATLQEGPLKAPNGVRFAFLGVPDSVRIELVELPKSAGV